MTPNTEFKKEKNINKLDFIKVRNFCQVLVAHACNPSYSGGRDQEDRGSKSARANSL
jgi:hypothetical protein